MLTNMTNNRFIQLVNLMLQDRKYILSIYQEYSPKKKADGFIVVIITETSSNELENLLKEDFGFCIFSGRTYGTIELWIYDRTTVQ